MVENKKNINKTKKDLSLEINDLKDKLKRKVEENEDDYEKGELEFSCLEADLMKLRKQAIENKKYCKSLETSFMEISIKNRNLETDIGSFTWITWILTFLCFYLVVLLIKAII